MSFEADEEILQDFLVEAAEILEQLSEQLVDLEQQPEDTDLLNAIFRGFHTVKGGAGFLQLTALVDCCHAAENVFDTLRKHQRTVTPDLMDVVLSALDNVNAMFEEVRAGQEPTPAEPELLELLASYAQPEDAQSEEETPSSASQTVTEQAQPVAADAGAMASEAVPQQTAEQHGQGADSGDITDAEFESLLNALHHNEQAASAKQAAAETAQQQAPQSSQEQTQPADAGDEITEDEFEALLDQLHGKGKHGGVPRAALDAPTAQAESAQPVTNEDNEGEGAATQPVQPAGSGDDLITEDEFEALLDQLHGKGKGPTSTDSTVQATATAPASSRPAAPSAPAKPEAASTRKADKVVANRGKKEVSAASAETTVRVDTARLDEIMNMVGELVLVRNRLVRLGGKSSDSEVAKAVANLDVVTADLQMSVMKTRMQPIKKVFGRFPRVVRDLSRNLKKEVNLELQGEETDLDKNLVEALADPLVHLVRNAVDHGIEMPDVREQAGKPRAGHVLLAAEQEGDHILLTIRDDGAGMDPDKLRRKAVEKGILDQDAADRLSDQEAFNLIFAAGLSTKEQISDVSGRGVGMDVVKTRIAQLNGTVNVWSELGKGTRISIKVPLTLAIMPTLMVMLGDQTFALPLVSVNEIFHLDISRTNVVDGQEVVVIRDKTLPLFHLKRWLVNGATDEAPRDSAHVVIVSVGTQQVGFVVDQLIGQEEVVIKPLGEMLHGTPGMAGATITGDGRIALILDIPGLLKRYASSSRVGGVARYSAEAMS